MDKNGIDVSKWQGNIDWQKVKNDGTDFAIIRSGWGKESPTQKDKFFEQNYLGAKSAGIPVGTYHYSYADSISDAKLEAQFCLKNIADKRFELPIAFDIEDRTMLALSTRVRTDICKAFCEEIEAAGYYAMIYANLDWFKNKLYFNELSKKYDIWLAQWDDRDVPDLICGIWQKFDCGKIDGINGNVDLNEAFNDYPQIMKNSGLNGFSKEKEENSEGFMLYTVKKGDNLWDISKNLLGEGIKYSHIVRLNFLDSGVIYPGQILKIPK